MENNNINLGLIGVGQWGKNYLSTIKEIEGAEISIAACKTMRNKSFMLSKYKITDNWHNITKSKEIDGIIIATPPNTHFEIASEAIKYGKPIIIEKPITLNLEEAKLLKCLALENDVLVKVNHIYLHHPMYKALKKNISKNFKIKSIYSLSGNYGPFREDVSPLWDWGPHDIAMCLDLIGEKPLRIEAAFSKKQFTVKNNMSNICARIEFKNKIIAELNFGNILEKKTRFLKINSEKISDIFDPINHNFIQEEKNFRIKEIKRMESDEIKELQESPLKIFLENFISNIKKSEFEVKDLKLSEDVVKILEIIDNKLN